MIQITPVGLGLIAALIVLLGSLAALANSDGEEGCLPFFFVSLTLGVIYWFAIAPHVRFL